MNQQVIVEFIADTSQLTPAEDKLVAMGKIDQQSANVFKATNDQIKQRNALLGDSLQKTQNLTIEVTEEQAIYNKLVASVKSLSGASKEAVQSLLKMSTKEIAAGFDKAAISVDDYVSALKAAEEQPPLPSPVPQDAPKEIKSLRAELKEITAQLAQLALVEDTNSDKFKQLTARAGQLKKAIDDAKNVVSNFGDDAPALKVVAAGIQGVSNAFQIAAGTSAIFGDENKDLQETLVKLNAVMAVNAGISQLLNTIQDGALIGTAKAIAAQQVKNAQTAISNALESESVVVRIAATAAQYGLNLAMSLSPLGIITVGLAAFVAGIVIFTLNAKKAAVAQAELNKVLSATGDILDAGVTGIEQANKKIISGLEERNARQSELDEQNLRALKSANKDRLQAIKELNATILANQDSTNDDTKKLVQDAKTRLIQLEKDYQSGLTDIQVAGNQLRKQLLIESLEDQANALQARLTLASKNSTEEFALQRQLATAKSAIDIQAAGDDAAKIKAIRAQLSRDLQDIDIAEAKVREDALEAALSSALIAVQNKAKSISERTTQAEIDAQKKIIQAQADFAIKQEGLTQEQIQNIKDKAAQDSLDLQRNFDKQARINAIQDQISANNAVLAQLNLSDSQRLDLQIRNIKLQASAEIVENKGLSDKIKEIQAKRDADIRAARLQSIQDTLQRELELTAAQQAAGEREIERQLAIQDQLRNANAAGPDAVSQQQLADQRLSLQQQLSFVDQLTAHKQDAIQKQIAANKEALNKNLIDEKTYQLQVAQLTDDQKKNFEDSEKRKTEIVNAELRARYDASERSLQNSTELVQATEAASLRAIEDSLQKQEALRNATGVGEQRMLERILGVRKQSVAEQLRDIDTLYAAQKRNTDAKLFTLQDELKSGTITQEEYNRRAAQLYDQDAKNHEDAEKRKTGTTNDEAAKRLEKEKKNILEAVEVASQALGLLSTIYQQDDQAAQARIDKQRQGIQDLQDAGAISAKEASARNKKLDAEQKQLQRQQAKRDKELAIFDAIINTARAVTQLLGNPVLAAIAGAIGAAQIAVIASRPIPQFGKGKKGNYQGWAEVGETGPELVQRGGRMYLEDKPTITWLGASDKVFNPKETAAMIEARVPSNFIPGADTSTRSASDRFDYDKMGKAVGANIPQYGVGFDVNGMYEYSRNKAAFTKYLTKRRTWGSR